MPTQTQSNQRGSGKLEARFSLGMTHIHPDFKRVKFLVAVSGGVDSMVLLELCRQSGLEIEVAHCNFLLRIPDCHADEEGVRAYCKKWNIPFHAKQFDTLAFQKQQKCGIQEAARLLRYEWFHALQEKVQAHAVLTAHHGEDKIETVLLNWMRGCGLSGLGALKWKNGQVGRPLLMVSKKEIQSFAKQSGVPWREDRSNADDKYRRNALRNQVLPVLEQAFPQALPTMFRSASLWEKELGVFLQLIQEKLASYVSQTSMRRVKCAFPPELPPENQEILLYYWLKDFGIAREQIQRIVDAQVGAQFKLNNGTTLVVERNAFFILPPDWDEVVLLDGVKVQEEEVGDSLCSALKWDDMELRTRKEGDVLAPGNQYKGRLSRFMINQKMPSHLKDKWPVLAKGNTVFWVPGFFKDPKLGGQGGKKTLKYVFLTEDLLN